MAHYTLKKLKPVYFYIVKLDNDHPHLISHAVSVYLGCVSVHMKNILLSQHTHRSVSIELREPMEQKLE